MQLSIIIVNYKCGQLINDCVSSFINQRPSVSYEIIIVDNDSKDDSKEKVTTSFPQIKWFEMPYNAGFARANNFAMRKAQGELILLLNPDTLIENNAIERCYEALNSSAYVACGVQLLNPDHTPQISGNYAMKGGLNYLLPLPYTGSAIKFFASIFKVKKPNVPQANGIVEVDWINGAFLMIKRAALNIAGYMDEDFFLYAEEAEWCSRLKKAGKLCIFGDINVIHLQGEISNDTFSSAGKGYFNLFDKKGLQIMLSNLVRIRKEFGTAWFLIILAAYTFEIPVFFILVTISKLFLSKKYAINQAIGYTKNVCSVIKLAPVIIKNKPHFYKVL